MVEEKIELNEEDPEFKTGSNNIPYKEDQILINLLTLTEYLLF